MSMGQSSEKLWQDVESHRGFLEVDAGGSTYVVMTMKIFREMMGVGTDDEYQESLREIAEGWADVQAGRSRPLDEFLDEFDRKHGIPKLDFPAVPSVTLKRPSCTSRNGLP